ncbi:MAG: radical SAM protein [Chloroflexi bacterium]|nr:radical SAM protein [Chloroflexota bacterium]
MQVFTSRRAEIERYFGVFPEVPKEVIVKEDILRLGVRFSEEALQAGNDKRPRTYYIFSYDQTGLGEMEKQESSRAPDEIRLSQGPYQLRPTLVGSRFAKDSPYIVDVVDGKTVLREEGEVLAEVQYPPVPRYYSKAFEDGTLYSETMAVIGWGHRAFSTLLRVCGHWGKKQECKFCDLNANARSLKKSGRPYTMRKKVEQVAEAAAEVFLNQPDDEPRRLSLRLSGGSIIDPKSGLVADEDFYLEYVRAIKERIGNRWPLILQTNAKDKATCKKMREAGVDAHEANIEVWDKNLFNILCPGKAAHFGWDEWIKRVLDSVDVFGEGNVSPGMVAGVEMCQPWGFKEVDQAVKSMTEGIEFLMSRGVVPRIPVWCIEPLSALGDNRIPPLEYFIRVDKAWYETWKKYSLPPLRGFQMGTGISVYQHTAALDFEG